MKTSLIMRTSKILTVLCFTKQKTKTKNTFARVVLVVKTSFGSVLVVKMY